MMNVMIIKNIQEAIFVFCCVEMRFQKQRKQAKFVGYNRYIYWWSLSYRVVWQHILIGRKSCSNRDLPRVSFMNRKNDSYQESRASNDIYIYKYDVRSAEVQACAYTHICQVILYLILYLYIISFNSSAPLLAFLWSRVVANFAWRCTNFLVYVVKMCSYFYWTQKWNDVVIYMGIWSVPS